MICKKWYNKEGQLHRTDGPAYEGADGYKAWYLNGVRHRTDGPAIEWSDGSISWYLNGVQHRTDGPTIEGVGYKAWYLNGIRLTEDLFLKVTEGPVKKLPLYLGLGFDPFISERLKHPKGLKHESNYR
jgi:hypothetical protein